jgi:hypothetical protein
MRERGADMADLLIVVTPKGLGTFSFPCGLIVKRPKEKKSEDDILARALWLERHGKSDDAEALLDRYYS